VLKNRTAAADLEDVPTHWEKPEDYLRGPADNGGPIDWHDPYRERARQLRRGDRRPLRVQRRRSHLPTIVLVGLLLIACAIVGQVLAAR
jgi:hypothetical protein